MTALRAGRADFNDREQGHILLRLDLSIIVATAALVALGSLVVYSATRGVLTEEDIPNRSVINKQLIFAGVGFVAAAGASIVDYRRIRAFVPLFYTASLLGLAGLFVFGSEFNNATSWYSLGFITLQPSEFAKLGLIVTMAAWFSHARSEKGLRFIDVLAGLALSGVLAALVLAQPDYGTVMVYGAIVAAIVMIAGVRPAHVVAVIGMLLVGLVYAFNTGQIQAYQIERFTAFADPDAQVRYNVNQSEIAIGSGGLRGSGLFNGTQNNNSLVPEKETDFIFSVLGEELGFVGGAAMLLLFGFLLLRIWRVAHLAENDFGRLICIGVFAMILFQAFQSVGMNMGMMPVTGIPLPLISAGGSSMITTLIAVGLVENVHAHRLR
ncbi:MAG: rod shape-determining protein RodA [Acidimicrobiales bacterium]|nr:rod shape-determining protein RodA [Acidimicrobiales bacterium]